MIVCSRRGLHAPIDPDELESDDGGDPELLPVVIPPDGWIGDPDDEDRIICCPTVAERFEAEGRQDSAERVIGVVIDHAEQLITTDQAVFKVMADDDHLDRLDRLEDDLDSLQDRDPRSDDPRGC